MVSWFTTEADYRSLADLSCELQWLKVLFANLGLLHNASMTVYCDNQSALYIVENLVYHERTKHIELDCHFVRECVQSKLLLLLYISTSMQVADVLTKPLGHALFHHHVRKLGVVDLHTPPWGGVLTIEVVFVFKDITFVYYWEIVFLDNLGFYPY